MSATDYEEEEEVDSDDDAAYVVSSEASSNSDGEARESKRARLCLMMKSKASSSKKRPGPACSKNKAKPKALFPKVRRPALPEGLLGSDAELESDDAESEGYEPLEIAPLLEEAAAEVIPETQPDSQSDFRVVPPSLPGHQQCAAHVLHHVSVDVDNVLSSLAGEELEGRPGSFLGALAKLGQLWRMKWKSSLVSIEFFSSSFKLR